MAWSFVPTVETVLRRARRVLRWIDPNDDPMAEPLSPLALIVVLVMACVSAFLFLRWKIQPMQDEGHHVAMTAIVTDYGRTGSIYPSIYKPFDWLNTNSLLYSIAGVFGKIIGPSWAFRITFGVGYLVGMPLANVWALRVFGRSAWAGVMAVPFCYTVAYVYGFSNFLFAAPLSIVLLPLFYRMLVRPTKWRVLATTIVLVLLFLAHVHVFMWTGALLFLMTLVAMIVALKHTVLGRPTPKPLIVVASAAASIIPSMILFARWMWKSRQPLGDDEFAQVGMEATGTTWASFKAAVPAPSQLLANIHFTIPITKTEDHSRFLILTITVLVIAFAITRLHSWKRPPVMELACALTFASYFFLPENAGGQAVIGSRQVGFAMWFAAAFFTPVPPRVTLLGRYFVVAANISLATSHLSYWHVLLRRFQRTEVAGLEEVLAAAPPRKILHYMNNEPSSAIFPLNTFWHVDKWYMIDKLGQVNENPAWGSFNSIRFKKAYNFHRPTNHSSNWSSVDEIWDNYDIVLVHNWHASANDLEQANAKGNLIIKRGPWELWQSKKSPAPLTAPAVPR